MITINTKFQYQFWLKLQFESVTPNKAGKKVLLKIGFIINVQIAALSYPEFIGYCERDQIPPTKSKTNTVCSHLFFRYGHELPSQTKQN